MLLTDAFVCSSIGYMVTEVDINGKISTNEFVKYIKYFQVLYIRVLGSNYFPNPYLWRAPRFG